MIKNVCKGAAKTEKKNSQKKESSDSIQVLIMYYDLIKSVLEIPVLETAHWVLIIIIILAESTAFSLSLTRQDIHHDWLRQLHAEPWHCALCHLLAVQAHQRAQGEDWHSLLGTGVSRGNLRQGREPAGPAFWCPHRQSAGRPVARCLPAWGPHLRHTGQTTRCQLELFDEKHFWSYKIYGHLIAYLQNKMYFFPKF